MNNRLVFGRSKISVVADMSTLKFVDISSFNFNITDSVFRIDELESIDFSFNSLLEVTEFESLLDDVELGTKHTFEYKGIIFDFSYYHNLSFMHIRDELTRIKYFIKYAEELKYYGKVC